MIIIYHNEECTKSRETMTILRKFGTDINVVEYMKTPPTPDEIRGLLTKLGMKASEIVSPWGVTTSSPMTS